MGVRSASRGYYCSRIFARPVIQREPIRIRGPRRSVPQFHQKRQAKKVAAARSTSTWYAGAKPATGSSQRSAKRTPNVIARRTCGGRADRSQVAGVVKRAGKGRELVGMGEHVCPNLLTSSDPHNSTSDLTQRHRGTEKEHLSVPLCHCVSLLCYGSGRKRPSSTRIRQRIPTPIPTRLSVE